MDEVKGLDVIEAEKEEKTLDEIEQRKKHEFIIQEMMSVVNPVVQSLSRIFGVKIEIKIDFRIIEKSKSGIIVPKH